jgi:hypothetical protein
MARCRMLISYCKLLLQVLPQLLRHGIARVLDGQVASLRSNLLSRERPLGVSPSRIVPPLLELPDLLLVVLILSVRSDTHVCERCWYDRRDCGYHLLYSVRQIGQTRYIE